MYILRIFGNTLGTFKHTAPVLPWVTFLKSCGPRQFPLLSLSKEALVANLDFDTPFYYFTIIFALPKSYSAQ
jgi:hypothetical protein